MGSVRVKWTGVDQDFVPNFADSIIADGSWQVLCQWDSGDRDFYRINMYGNHVGKVQTVRVCGYGATYDNYIQQWIGTIPETGVSPDMGEVHCNTYNGFTAWVKVDEKKYKFVWSGEEDANVYPADGSEIDGTTGQGSFRITAATDRFIKSLKIDGIEKVGPKSVNMVEGFFNKGEADVNAVVIYGITKTCPDLVQIRWEWGGQLVTDADGRESNYHLSPKQPFQVGQQFISPDILGIGVYPCVRVTAMYFNVDGTTSAAFKGSWWGDTPMSLGLKIYEGINSSPMQYSRIADAVPPVRYDIMSGGVGGYELTIRGKECEAMPDEEDGSGDGSGSGTTPPVNPTPGPAEPPTEPVPPVDPIVPPGSDGCDCSPWYKYIGDQGGAIASSIDRLTAEISAYRSGKVIEDPELIKVLQDIAKSLVVGYDDPNGIKERIADITAAFLNLIDSRRG